MKIKKIFIKNKKRILASGAALVIIAATVFATFSENVINNNNLKASVLVASAQPVIQRGSTGEAVNGLQESLAVFGYFTSESGFGAQTEAAVKDFQYRKGLSPNGVVNAATWQAISTAVDEGWYIKDISSGRVGSDVYQLQDDLMALGYHFSVYMTEGLFGQEEEDAVKDFQSKHGLPVTGDVDIKTGMAINAALMPKINTVPAKPPMPTGFKATSHVGYITLSWNPSAGATSYKLYRATGTSDYRNFAVISQGSNATFYDDRDLTSGITYYYIIYAMNADAESPESDMISAQPTAPAVAPEVTENPSTQGKPQAPKDFTATGKNGYISLLWTASDDAISYNLSRSEDDGGPYSAFTRSIGITYAPFIDNSVKNGTNYYYVVQAVSNGGTSLYSNQASAMPTANNGPPLSLVIPLENAATPEVVTPSFSTAPDIIDCKMFSTELIMSTGIPIRLDCTLVKKAFITVWIIKGEYDPSKAPSADSVIQTIIYNQFTLPKSFYLLWDGNDKYDRPGEEGDYTFLVSAKLAEDANSDYSGQKFNVLMEPPPQPKQTQTPEQTAAAQVRPAAQEPAPPPEPSKCPGVNYPTDIGGHWAEAIIKQAYDLCIIKGYVNGTFKPDMPITRAEAVKVALLGAKIPPVTDCYDADCGTPFTDLKTWQSGWIRAAWNNKIIKGVSENLFMPDNTITRAQAAYLTVKTFKIPPYQGCYTANCGAGYPDNIFEDIYALWQGPFIRALWDGAVVQGIWPHQFIPDIPVTRAELVKMILLARQNKGI